LCSPAISTTQSHSMTHSSNNCMAGWKASALHPAQYSITVLRDSIYQ